MFLKKLSLITKLLTTLMASLYLSVAIHVYAIIPNSPHISQDVQKYLNPQPLQDQGSNVQSSIAALVRGLEDQNPEVRSSAALALGRIGTPALSAEPLLIEMLRKESKGSSEYKAKISAVTALGWFGPNAKEALADLVEFFGKIETSDYSSHATAVALENIAGARGLLKLLIESLDSKDEWDETTIAQIFRLTGPSLREIVPDIVALMKDEKGFHTVVDILEGLGPNAKEAVPALTKLLDDPKKRERAIDALTDIGFEAKAAVPALLELLREPKLYGVETALVAIQPNAETALPILIKLLDDPTIRQRAIKVLASMKSQAQAAIPSLLQVIKTDKNIDAQQDALLAISAIGSADDQTIDVLINSFQKPELQSAAAIALGKLRSNLLLAVTALSSNLQDYRFREEKIRVLGEIGTAAKASVPALVGVLKYECHKYKEEIDWISENHRLCADTIASLASIGSPAVPDLITLLKSKSEEDRSLAAIALAKLEANAQAAIPVLVTALQDQDEYVRRFAAAALGKIGVAALPSLFKAFQSQTSTTQELAAAALADMGGAAVPGLVDMLTVTTRKTRLLAMTALAQLGYEALPAIPKLVKVLKDKDLNIRNRAAIAIGRIGPEARHAIPALIEALSDSDSTVRSSAAVALGYIGSDAITAVPALVKALTDHDSTVRSHAAAAIGTIDPGTEINPVLIAALQDADPSVRQHAAVALGEINSEIDLAPSTLIQSFESEDWNVQRNAAEKLIRIGSKALPYLRDALRSKNLLIRRNAAYTLLRFGSESEVLRPELLRALGDEDIFVFTFSLFALDNFFKDIEGNNPQLSFAVAEAYLNFFEGSKGQELGHGGVDRPIVCYILRAIDDGAANRLHLSCSTAGRAWQWVGVIFNQRSRR